MAGYKIDGGKNRMSLIPPIVDEALGAVLTYGATKYPAYNWAEGMDYSRVMDALKRHLKLWWEGEDSDPESRLSHLWHVLACVSFLISYEEYGMGNDDRFPWRDEVRRAMASVSTVKETPFDVSDVSIKTAEVTAEAEWLPPRVTPITIIALPRPEVVTIKPRTAIAADENNRATMDSNRVTAGGRDFK